MDEGAKKFLTYFVLAVVIIKFVIIPMMYDPSKYHGKGFNITAPAEWEKSVKKIDGKTTLVTFNCPEINYMTELPEAVISILSYKLPHSLWIEDEFPTLVSAIQRDRNIILDQGEVKIDEQVAKWVLYRDQGFRVFNMEFYMITESNMFYKVLFSSYADFFDKHRPVFEEMKNSWKFKIGMF